MQVFLSYRRSDVGGYAGRLTDALTQRLGRRSVFHDVTTITPGEDYMVAIDRALDQCDAVLAVIGPGWLAASPGSSTPRLFESDDVVRLELSRALAGSTPVVPVLVGQARLPAAEDLPEDLRPLRQRQAVTLRDESWHDDVVGLLRSLRGASPVPAVPWRRWAAAVVAAALLGGATAVWLAGRGDDRRGPVVAGASTSGSASTGGGSSTDPEPACPPTDGPEWSSVPLAPEPVAEVTVDEGPLTFTVLTGRWRPSGTGWQVVLVTAMGNRTPGELYHYAGRYAGLEVAKRRSEQPSCFSGDDSPVSPGAVGEAVAGFDVACRPVGRLDLVLADESKLLVTAADESVDAC